MGKLMLCFQVLKFTMHEGLKLQSKPWQTLRKILDGCVPIPPSSLGLYIPPRIKKERGPFVPGWLKETNNINVDLTGVTSTDSPRGEDRPWNAGAAPRSIEG